MFKCHFDNLHLSSFSLSFHFKFLELIFCNFKVHPEDFCYFMIVFYFDLLNHLLAIYRNLTPI
jgi:hypothetical protein